MDKSEAVAVVGAGFGGLFAAIVLARLGFPVHLFERRSRSGGGSKPIVIHDNGQRALEALGLSHLLEGATVLKGISLEILGDAPLGHLRFEEGGPWRPSVSLLARDLILGLVAEAEAAGVNVHLGARVHSAWVEEGRAFLSLGEGDNRAYGALIVADGAASGLRAPMGFQGEAEPTGVAWLWGVSAEASPEGELVEILGPSHTRFVSFPLSEGRSGFYCTVPAGTWTRILGERLEPWLEGWAPFGAWPMRCLRGVEDWERIAAIEALEVDLKRWSNPPAFILGDAAHAMPVGLGWGASAAMVDGLVLGQLIARGANVAVDLGDIGRTWENVRRPFIAQALALSHQLLALADLTSAPARLLREAIVPLAKRTGFLGDRLERVLMGHYPLEEPYFREIRKE